MAGTGPTGPGSRSRMISGINVTPLVDIVLVLLIIFLVTAKFTSSAPAVPIDLPSASQSDEMQTIFAVTITAEGELYVDGESVKLEAVRPRAELARVDDPELRAVIQADGKVTHQRVLDVMDALRAADLKKVAFATKRPEAAGGE